MRGTIVKRLKRTAKLLSKHSTVKSQRMYKKHPNGRITIFWQGERRIYQLLKKEWKNDSRFINHYYPDGFSVNTAS